MTGAHHHAQFISIEIGVSQTFLPILAWNCDPPNLSFPNSYWDYRHGPLAPGTEWEFLNLLSQGLSKKKFIKRDDHQICLSSDVIIRRNFQNHNISKTILCL
jgi:hypothetical protein